MTQTPAFSEHGEDPKIAVLIPCYNEEITIAQVVRDFRAALPEADVYVYDNNSTDRTREVAHAAGAIVCTEPLQGKGSVIRRMFSDIEADFYVMVDGDATYDASAAPEMVRLARHEKLDMVNAARVNESVAAYRPGHVLGNRMLTGLVTFIFGKRLSDMLSGYRVFSRRFVKSFPAMATGFETETELTVHALELRMPIGEVKTRYFERPEGSVSKLHTYRDGVRILSTIVMLVKKERPLLFFSLCGLVLALIGLGLGVPVVIHYLNTGLVPRLPTAILATACMTLAAMAIVCGLILDCVVRGQQEVKRLFYLQLPSP